MAVKGYIGDAEVTLDNAAEQATLEAILKAIDKNADANGDGVLGKASKGLIKNSLNPLGLATKALTGSFTLLGKALGTVTALAGGIAKAGTSATVFSTGLLQSQSSITDLTKAVKEIQKAHGGTGGLNTLNPAAKPMKEDGNEVNNGAPIKLPKMGQ